MAKVAAGGATRARKLSTSAPPPAPASEPRDAGGPGTSRLGALVLSLALLAAGGCGDPPAARHPAPTRVAPAPGWEEVAAHLSTFVRHEMEAKRLRALSIALVEGDDVVWADGFGWEDPTDSVPADAATVYRVGSVSKLFTDLAVVRAVEAGRLSLDEPSATTFPTSGRRTRSVER